MNSITTSRITLEVYTQGVNKHKRAAQTRVVKMMLQDLGKEEEKMDPGSKEK